MGDKRALLDVTFDLMRDAGLAMETGILSIIWRVFLLVEERVRREWTFSMFSCTIFSVWLLLSTLK